MFAYEMREKVMKYLAEEGLTGQVEISTNPNKPQRIQVDLDCGSFVLRKTEFHGWIFDGATGSVEVLRKHARAIVGEA